MVTLFVLTWLLSLLAGVVGLIKPQWLKLASRKSVLWICGCIAFASMIGIGATAPPTKTEPAVVTENSVQVTTTSTQIVAVGQNNNQQHDTDVQVQTTSPAAKTIDTQPLSNTSTAPVQQPTSEPTITLYTVASVIDGDTLKITMNGKLETLRLIGMDTPETVDPRKPVQCFGKEASNKAKELLAGKKISIETDPSQGERDKYGRLLVYVRRSDGLFYNQYMIEQGYAHEYTYNLPYKYQNEFKAVQKEAQAAQRGLWSPSTCNGNTTQTATQPAPTVTTQPTPVVTNDQLAQPTTNPTQTVSEQPQAEPAQQADPAPAQVQTGSKYYTSSHYSAQYYYPEACDGWKTLSTRYLKTFDSLKALLAAYPSRILSPQCN